jgi:peptidoglycan/LPS O-acetylase OafA/YrhL
MPTGQPLGDAATASPERLDALTGLRFVAAAAVFVYHLPGWLQVPGFNPGPLGQAAVGYFFVLSGFILAHVYRRRGAPLSAGRFYRARFARIWPLHIACLLAVLAILPASIPDTLPKTLQLLAHTALLQGWSWDSGWSLAWNGPAWSLSVEAFFYALFPLLVARRTRTLLVVYGLCWLGNAALYATAEHLAVVQPWRTQTLAHLAASFPLPRLQEFVLGICANDLWQRRVAHRATSTWTATACEVGSAAAVIACYFTFAGGQWGPAWIGATSAPITVGALAQGPGLSFAYAATIVVAATGAGLLSRSLATAGMVYLGEISYAVYLVHTPVMMSVSAAMRHHEFLWHLPLLVGITGTLAAAAWLHAVVELPARQALLAQGIGAGARTRLLARTIASGVRDPKLLLLTLLAVGALAVARWSSPTAEDFAQGVAAQSDPGLRGVRFGAAIELLGATLFANPDGMRCWVAMVGDHRDDGTAVTHAELEARTAEGQLVHRFALRADTSIGDDARATTVFTAEAPLQQLLGAAVLALVVKDRAGAVLAPGSGPIAADGRSLELLRLP